MSKKDKFAGISAGLGEALDKIQPPMAPAAPKTAPGQLMAFRSEMIAYEDKIAALEAKVKDLESTALPVTDISPNPWQPRRLFDEADIQKLADSIAELGLIQPIVVRRVPTRDILAANSMGTESVPSRDTFEIVAGERRLRAHQLLAKPDIKAVVLDVSDADMALMALAENLDREDLTDYETSKAIRRVQSEFPSKKRMAEVIGIGRQDIYKYLAFDDLPAEILQDLETNPRLLGRNAAEDIVGTIKKHGAAAGDVVSKVWARVKAGDLDQGKIAATIEFTILRGHHTPADRDIRKLFVGKEQAGSITRDGKAFTVKIKAAALSPEKEKQLREFVEGLFK